MTWGPTPITLTGQAVTLVPLSAAHAGDLLEAAADPEIWCYLPLAQPSCAADMQAFIDGALRDVAASFAVVFAIVDANTGRAVGSTRYMDFQPQDRGLEIGWTWLGRAAQHTAINTECKFLLREHAFEQHRALRVQLKTDDRNHQRSKAAIARIGASFEGVLHCHRVLPDGYVRDSAYFSVVHHEWPRVCAALEMKLRSSSQGR